MPFISIILRGTDKDHHIVSPELSEDEAAAQLALIHGTQGVSKPAIPWMSAQAKDIIAAQIIDE